MNGEPWTSAGPNFRQLGHSPAELYATTGTTVITPCQLTFLAPHDHTPRDHLLKEQRKTLVMGMRIDCMNVVSVTRCALLQA